MVLNCHATILLWTVEFYVFHVSIFVKWPVYCKYTLYSTPVLKRRTVGVHHQKLLAVEVIKRFYSRYDFSTSVALLLPKCSFILNVSKWLIIFKNVKV